MEMKILKTILISIAVLGAGFLLVPLTQAQNNNLVVQFEQQPLFNEASFLPGQSVTRWVKVTNNSNLPQLIATQAIKVNDPNWLGAVLILEIKENGIRRYKNDLSRFFSAGEVTLSDSKLAGNGAQTQYDFTVSFYSGAQNVFQEKTLGFDILIGFQGTEGGLLPGAGGGVGGYLPPGLTIIEGSVMIPEDAIGETSVTIAWTTSYLSTSQVIYAKAGEKRTLCLTQTEGCAIGNPPKYGYERTTPEYDISPKVTPHYVVITGLTPGTKYYYRTVSHASLAIGREYSFTTKGVAGEVAGTAAENQAATEKQTGTQETASGQGAGQVNAGEQEGITQEATAIPKEPSETPGGLNFLANLSSFFSNKTSNWMWRVLILAVIVLLIAWLWIKRKRNKLKT